MTKKDFSEAKLALMFYRYLMDWDLRNSSQQATFASGCHAPAIRVLNVSRDADAIARYGTADDQQNKKEPDATGELEAISGRVAQLAALRHEIQLAADQAWNWRTPGVETIRKAFLLPANRPLP
jgi:hypothetical protein